MYFILLNINAINKQHIILLLDIKQEKQHLELLEGVTKFNKGKLKRADTLEKDILPTKEGLNLCT